MFAWALLYNSVFDTNDCLSSVTAKKYHLQVKKKKKKKTNENESQNLKSPSQLTLQIHKPAKSERRSCIAYDIHFSFTYDFLR
jgi:hypothetical protein